MTSELILVVVLIGLLGFSMVVIAAIGMQKYFLGLPVEESVPYYPQAFYPSPVILASGDGQASSGRIVGGTEAGAGAAPHMVALVVGELVRSFLCGGALLSRRRVLTAAHCIDPLLSWVDGQLIPSASGQIGSNSLSGGYSVVRFSGHENHPEWDRWFIKNDVGMLRLAEPLEWSDRVRPIAVSYEWLGGGQFIRVTGWGTLSAWGVVPDRLQELRARVLSPAQCEAGVREANALLGPSPPVQPEVELCTRHERGAGYGMCNGDSGSAVTWEGRAVGVVSWGWACALGHPDVHARLAGFRDWLPGAMAGDQDSGQE